MTYSWCAFAGLTGGGEDLSSNRWQVEAVSLQLPCSSRPGSSVTSLAVPDLILTGSSVAAGDDGSQFLLFGHKKYIHLSQALGLVPDKEKNFGGHSAGEHWKSRSP